MENTKMTLATILLRLSVGISQASNGISVDHDDGESYHGLVSISEVMNPPAPSFAAALFMHDMPLGSIECRA